MLKLTNGAAIQRGTVCRTGFTQAHLLSQTYYSEASQFDLWPFRRLLPCFGSLACWSSNGDTVSVTWRMRSLIHIKKFKSKL